MMILDDTKTFVRSFMKIIAGWLDKASGGKISPNFITFTGLLAHIPIALLIAAGTYRWAALLLIIFGLFDTLDGELARLQKSATPSGMFLDTVTDRIKEVMLYTASGYSIIATTGRPYLAVWAIAACGTALLVGYVNAWGETVLALNNIKNDKLNKAFRSGLASFEIRMLILLIGLLSSRLALAIIVIAILAGWTALVRLTGVRRSLRSVQD